MQRYSSIPRGASPAGFSPLSSGATTPLRSTAPTLPLYLPPRLVDRRQRHKVALERINFRLQYRLFYLSDFYHTLVNCRWTRFYLLFVLFYMAMFAAFAALYVSQGPQCVTSMHTFWHALWFSVQSSATIGFGHQAPNPDCFIVQWGLTAQVLVSLLMQASLLGLVYARISSSAGRSWTIRFSKSLSIYRGDDGFFRLAFRVANLRQHQVLSPKVRLLLLRLQHAHPFSSGQMEYVYSELSSAHIGGGHLWLGVPSVIEHKIDQRSALWGMSEADIMAADMEFIVLLNGTDESTSRAMEARHSYVPADICWQHHFEPCIERRQSGKLGVDFARFDATRPRTPHPSYANLAGGTPGTPSMGGTTPTHGAPAADPAQHAQQIYQAAAAVAAAAEADGAGDGGTGQGWPVDEPAALAAADALNSAFANRWPFANGSFTTTFYDSKS